MASLAWPVLRLAHSSIGRARAIHRRPWPGRSWAHASAFLPRPGGRIHRSWAQDEPGQDRCSSLMGAVLS
eukprot:842407-Pyramimonas_sp.AAC.1